MIEEGEPAPDFELESDAGETVKLSALRGKPVVLYFYPKDDTPGCTTQACGDPRRLRRVRARRRGRARRLARRRRLAREVQGASTTCRSRSSPTPTTRSPSAYGVWGEKKSYGKTYMGIVRSTFVIDADGKREEGHART